MPFKVFQFAGQTAVRSCRLSIVTRNKHQNFASRTFGADNPLVTGEFLPLRNSNVTSVSMLWRHYGLDVINAWNIVEYEHLKNEINRL